MVVSLGIALAFSLLQFVAVRVQIAWKSLKRVICKGEDCVVSIALGSYSS